VEFINEESAKTEFIMEESVITDDNISVSDIAELIIGEYDK
jgi:hypothetical protein